LPPASPPPASPASPPPVSSLAEALLAARTSDQINASANASLSSSASSHVAGLLQEQEQVSLVDAEAATDLLSWMLEQHQGVDGSAMDGKDVERLQSAVRQVSRVALVGAGPVQLTSPQLNITAETRQLTDVAAAPIVCVTRDASASAVLPTAEALLFATGLNASLPVAMLLTVTRTNMHGTVLHEALSATDDGGEDGGEEGGEEGGPVGVSSLVSFALLQQGAEVEVKGLPEPINISLPYHVASVSVDACVGPQKPAAAAAAAAATAEGGACTRQLECRWWTGEGWSAEGCRTFAGEEGEGTLVCSCDHLTDFMVFELPTSLADVRDTLMDELQVNSLSWGEVAQCLSTPDWQRLHFVYSVVGLLCVVGIIGLGHAVTRDRRELKFVEALVSGRRRDDARAAWRRAARRMSGLGGFLAASRPAVRAEGGGGPGPDTQPPKAPLKAAVAASRAVAPSAQAVGWTRPPPLSPSPPLPQMPVVGVPVFDAERTIARDGQTKKPDDAAFEVAFALPSPVRQAPVLSPLGSQAARLHRHAHPAWASPPPSPPSSPTLPKLSDAVALAMASSGGRRAGAARPQESKWVLARRLGRQVTLTRRWHRDVDRRWKSLWGRCKRSHTLMTGVLFRGISGFTRAQTVMVLLNSLAIELVVLCMFFSTSAEEAESGGRDATLVINPLAIVTGSAVSALVALPSMLACVALFRPITLAVLAWRLATAPLRLVARIRAGRSRWRVASSSRSSKVLPLVHGPADAVVARSDVKPAAHYSYASLNEHLLVRSLTRSVQRRDWHVALHILAGWLCNVSIFAALQLLFVSYGCSFQRLSHETESRQLAIAWALSAGQRFLLHEPALIVLGQLVPALFAHSCMAALFGESCIAAMSYLVDAILAAVKAIRSG